MTGIAAVAQSVVRTETQVLMGTRLYAEQTTKWNDLFNFLSLSNQGLLEFQARIYASTLPCFTDGHIDELGRDCGLRTSVRNVSLRALQLHPCDLWTPCTLLSSLSSQTIEEIMINFLRTVQYASILTGNNFYFQYKLKELEHYALQSAFALVRSWYLHFAYNDINVTSYEGLIPHIKVQLSLPLFQLHPHMKHVRPALTQAIKELIGSRAERALNIAMIVTGTPVRKDFVLDPKEDNMKKAAYHTMRAMTAGMAMITCRDPLAETMISLLQQSFKLIADFEY